jgi:hypothetical protein
MGERSRADYVRKGDFANLVTSAFESWQVFCHSDLDYVCKATYQRFIYDNY